MVKKNEVLSNNSSKDPLRTELSSHSENCSKIKKLSPKSNSNSVNSIQ